VAKPSTLSPEKPKMIKRNLTALFGAFLFSIITSLAYFLLFETFPLEGLEGIATVSAAGAVIGALFPRVRGFIFEMFLEI
jgi:hypothetical protein